MEFEQKNMKFTKILTIALVVFCIALLAFIFYKKDEPAKINKNTENEFNTNIESNTTGETETDQFFYSTGERENIEVTKSGAKLLDSFNSEKLAENALGCSKDQDKEYYDRLLDSFSNNDVLYTYSFKYKNIPNGEWTINVIPNKLGYKNYEDFNNNFGLCEAGATMYPSLVSEKYLLFISSCGTGVDSPEARICDELREIIEKTIRLK